MSKPPSPEAYGRVTNPERFAPMVVAAESLIAKLMETFDVEQVAGQVAVDFPDWDKVDDRTIRLIPSQGVPVAFLFTDFPGVLVRFGDWGVAAFPACGCDACDEQPEELVRRLTEMVEAAAGGRYIESLARWTLPHEWSPWPRRP